MSTSELSSATALFGRIAMHNKLINQQQWDEAVKLHLRTGGQLPVADILVQQGFLTAARAEAINKKVDELESKNKSVAAPAPSAASMRKPPAAPAPSPDDSGDPIPLSGEDPPPRPVGKPTAKPTGAKPTEARPAEPAPVPAPPPMPTPVAAAAAGKHERIPCDVKPLDVDPFAAELIREAIRQGASDVHFASGSPPFYRLHGALTMTRHPPLSKEKALRIVLGFMDDAQQQHWLRTKDIDFSFQSRDLGRFRVNALEQFRGPDIVFRIIPPRIPTMDELGLPESVKKFTEWHQGLVLVTGPAGSGKTTTAAALIDMINTTRKDHIITVEDPVEFLHVSKGCNVTQRQVPIHTLNFASALKAALREDPDIILIGEMRDLETVSLAIRAAETGHLVIGTLQTKNAPRTIDRVVDVFPSDQQAQIRTMLSESLRGIISQALVPTADGKGRVLATELMFITGAISNLIRDSRTFQLHSIMETGRRSGHRLMDDSLTELLRAGRITKEEAIKVSENPKRFR